MPYLVGLGWISAAYDYHSTVRECTTVVELQYVVAAIVFALYSIGSKFVPTSTVRLCTYETTRKPTHYSTDPVARATEAMPHVILANITFEENFRSHNCEINICMDMSAMSQQSKSPI